MLVRTLIIALVINNLVSIPDTSTDSNLRQLSYELQFQLHLIQRYIHVHKKCNLRSHIVGRSQLSHLIMPTQRLYCSLSIEKSLLSIYRDAEVYDLASNLPLACLWPLTRTILVALGTTKENLFCHISGLRCQSVAITLLGLISSKPLRLLGNLMLMQ